VLRRWAGPLVALLIVGGVVLIVGLNLNLRPSKPAITKESTAPSSAGSPSPSAPKPARFREYPIGDEALRNHMRIAAVWLPPIAMEGMPAPSSGGDVIHLEADIHATEGNPNGFAKDEFVPYLKIRYAILPADPGGGTSGTPIHQGELTPMVARDGLHYGASLSMPRPGTYRLIYSISSPSAGGLGRHSDPVTGVAPWWEPFEVSFDWDYPGPPRS
jgi:uncharacterized protein involved in high-affinity Fe2+ transport